MVWMLGPPSVVQLGMRLDVHLGAMLGPLTGAQKVFLSVDVLATALVAMSG